MQQPPDARLTPDIAQGLCVRTASAAVLEGSIASLGSQYVLGLRAKNCTTGDILADEQAQASRKEEVLGALSRMATRFRSAWVNRSPPSRNTRCRSRKPRRRRSKPGRPSAPRREPTIQAAPPRPCRCSERAVAIDPDFALAHARLGIHYSNVGESTLARESTLKAYRLRDRASDVERFLIDTFYDRQVTGNLERQQQTHGVVGADISARSGSSRIAGGSRDEQHRQIRAVDCRSRQGLALEPDLSARI